MNMQSAILGKIKEAVTERGYEYRFQPDFSNNGRVYIAPKGSFKNTVNFAYDFQAGYGYIYVYSGNVEPHGGMVPSPGLITETCFQYSNSEKIETIIGIIVDSCPNLKKSKPRKSAAKTIKG
jgi:hypothetical protein